MLMGLLLRTSVNLLTGGLGGDTTWHKEGDYFRKGPKGGIEECDGESEMEEELKVKWRSSGELSLPPALW